MALGDCVDCELGSCEHIASDEDVGLCGLVCQAVCDRSVSAAELYLGALEQIAPLDGLADGEDDPVRGKLHGLGFIVERREAVVLVEDARTLLEDYAADLSVGSPDFLRAPAELDRHIVLAGLCDLGLGGGHDVLGLQAEHRDSGGSASLCDAGCVDCDVSASDDDNLLSVLIAEVSGVGNLQEIDCGRGALCILSRDSRKASALASDCNVEGLVALLAQLCDCDVLSDLDSGLYLHAHFLHHFDFGVDDVLLELVGGNSVCQHSAGALVLLEDRGIVAHLGKIEGT